MKGEFNVKYSNKDIMDKLENIDIKINKVHEQVIIINGTVSGHTKQLNAHKTLIYGSYAFIFAIASIALLIAL